VIRMQIGGLAAKEIAEAAARAGGDQVEVRVASDVAGARAVAQGEADYYLGACATGGGGALAMATAILGYSRCFTASTAGRPPRGEIRQAVAGGKQAFGFTTDHIAAVVPLIVTAILAQQEKRLPPGDLE